MEKVRELETFISLFSSLKSEITLVVSDQRQFLEKFLTKDNLWRRIIIQKIKLLHNAPNQQKYLTLAFPIISQYLDWKVGNGTKARIGIDSITGCRQHIFLPKGLNFCK